MEKINATVVINHIDNITIGQSIFINYITDSDGIVTIKVNGTPVSVGNFTPDKAGIYNVLLKLEKVIFIQLLVMKLHLQ